MDTAPTTPHRRSRSGGPHLGILAIVSTALVVDRPHRRVRAHRWPGLRLAVRRRGRGLRLRAAELAEHPRRLDDPVRLGRPPRHLRRHRLRAPPPPRRPRARTRDRLLRRHHRIHPAHGLGPRLVRGQPSRREQRPDRRARAHLLHVHHRRRRVRHRHGPPRRRASPCPSLILGFVPRWLAWTGLVIAALAELSFLSMAIEPLQFLLPIGRFGGLLWLIAVGFLLPNDRREVGEAAAAPATTTRRAQPRRTSHDEDGFRPRGERADRQRDLLRARRGGHPRGPGGARQRRPRRPARTDARSRARLPGDRDVDATDDDALSAAIARTASAYGDGHRRQQRRPGPPAAHRSPSSIRASSTSRGRELPRGRRRDAQRAARTARRWCTREHRVERGDRWRARACRRTPPRSTPSWG